MMKYDDLYFASRYNFFTDCVEWYFLPKTEIKVFLKKMDIRGFGWRPSIYTLQNLYTHTINVKHIIYMQESSGHPHIDQYRSKLYSLYTFNDRL